MKFDKVDEALLVRWNDVSRLQERTENLAYYLKEEAKKCLSVLKSQPWWKEDMHPDIYDAREVYYYRESWRVGPGKYLCVGFWDFTMDALSEGPAGHVWDCDLGDKKDLFRRILRQEAADVLEKLGAEQHDEWDHPVWFPIHHTPAEWAAVLREDRLTHEVRGAFERLAVLLTPLDRAIARVQANSSRKKH